jgi:streptomycin 6-kinase
MSARPDMDALARLASDVAAEWHLTLGSPFSASQFSFVVPAGEDAVLKIVPEQDDESRDEVDALALWNGEGAVRLLRHDAARKALLLERVKPGTDLTEVSDEEATKVAVSVGQRIWRPAGAPFRWIADHVPGWMDAAEDSPYPGRELLPLARRLYAELTTIGHDTLIHGDFQHYNMLRQGENYVVIDPKPMLGEPEFDIPAFLWNPLTYEMNLVESRRRIAAFAAAKLDEERIRAWAVIRGAYLGAEAHEVEVLRELSPL